MSSQPSRWLRLIAWFFKLGGLLFALGALFALAGLILDLPSAPGNPSHALTLFVLSSVAGALLTTGFLLAKRARAGAFMALGLALYPWAFVLAGVRTFSWLDIIYTVVTSAVIASIWPQLSSRHI